MAESGYFFTAWDESDPEARRDDEFQSAWDALSEEEPPEGEGECPACGGLPETGCSVCRMAVARPEGGERDG